MLSKVQISSVIIALLVPIGVSIHQKLRAQDIISTAQEHFDKFNNVEGGWCAADATISLPLPDGKTLWLFGDTFIGEKTGLFSINPNNAKMINNCAIIEDSNGLKAYYGGTQSNPSSFIPGDGSDFFWPEHATIENDTLKILAVRVMYQNNGTPGFNFRVGTSYIATYKYPSMEYIKTSKINYITDSTMRFGACILRSGDYTYIFGVKDTTAEGMTWPVPYLARVGQSIDNPWEFYAGTKGWSTFCDDAKPVGNRPMSESFYVYEKNNKFYLIMHEIWTVGELYILEADAITGPWNRKSSGGNETLFAKIQPQTGLFSYNLFAHPQFQVDGKILISFNVNTTDFSSIYSDTRNYRARFYWLSVENAAATTSPTTITLHDHYTEVYESDGIITPSKIFFTPNDCNLTCKGIPGKSLLTIYGIDGKIYFEKYITDDVTYSISNLPKTLLIVKLSGEWGTEIKKIINH